MYVNVAGVISVTNEKAAAGGVDVESDVDFFARYHLRRTLPITSGNKNHYITWATEVAGVSYASCIPLWNGNGTVKVVIAGADRGPVDEQIRSSCAAHIEEERPIGATVTVVSVVEREIPLTAAVTTVEGYSKEQVKNQLTAAVSELLLNQPFGEVVKVPFSRFLACLLQCPGRCRLQFLHRGWRDCCGHPAGRGCAGGRHRYHHVRGALFMSGALSMRERVPDYHYASEQSKALIETLEDASLEAKAALEDVMAQFFINTATWGLALWEQQVGIETDNSLSLESRRSAILQKLVASGNTTAEMIRGLAETITGYEAKVEVNDDYSFSLSFWGEQTKLAAIDVVNSKLSWNKSSRLICAL